jgi:hypothetical protein
MRPQLIRVLLLYQVEPGSQDRHGSLHYLDDSFNHRWWRFYNLEDYWITISFK